MGMANGCNSNYYSPVISTNVKVVAVDSNLQQFVVNFKELLLDYEQLQTECENVKQQVVALEKICESTNIGIEELTKVLAAKNLIIQSVASSLTKLNDTKDWNVLTETFKLLFEDTSMPKEEPATKICNTTPKTPVKVLPEETSPIYENSVTENASIEDESLCEIEGTPTGRTSPIIHTKKTKGMLSKSSNYRDKKKCSETWPTSESKSIKLVYPTPRSKVVKFRQTRLNLMKSKQTSVVDLTCSPELSSGNQIEEPELPLIKKEPMERDLNILPTITSGASFVKLKTTTKDSPSKFKKPPLSLKIKTEKCEMEPKQDENRNIQNDITEMEYSINILNPFANRINSAKSEKPPALVKTENLTPSKQVPMDEDATHCEINSSISLLDQVNKLEQEHFSTAKRPLAENINIMNTPPKEAESSISILQHENKMAAVGNVKRRIPELVEPIYKEPTVRNKQEKKNLQGWSCEQCKNFYSELYKNDPVMLAKKINECSKHRGKHNPERPKTPPNFWNPRWHVPEDTEELNRMNNAN